MDITITQNVELYALASLIFGAYFTGVKPQFHAWVDKLPDAPNNVWKRVQNSGSEKLAPYVKVLTLLATKLAAPIAFFSFSMLMILTPLGYFSLANEIADYSNYFMGVPAVMILIAVILQAVFIKQEKKRRDKVKGN